MCIVLFVVIGVVSIMGVYAFNNPDPSGCWYVEGLQRPALTKAEITQVASENGI